MAELDPLFDFLSCEDAPLTERGAWPLSTRVGPWAKARTTAPPAVRQVQEQVPHGALGIDETCAKGGGLDQLSGGGLPPGGTVR
ncbi:hypothetical protein GCM10010394_55170 [Streptomyces crystallinus]|uniref:Transposase n=1 Tax=Streptomyces crystallinus TaxID=68191 RepID=A0ABN1GS39_9ACTN